MKYIRCPDLAASSELAPGYHAQILSSSESCLTAAIWLAPGACGAGLHFHDTDQAVYVMSGCPKIQLGDESHELSPGSFVFIPAGVAHRSWNEDLEDVNLIEVFLPGPPPGRPLLTVVESPSEAPGSAVAPLVRTTDAADFLTPDGFPNMGLCALADAESALINAVRMGQGSAGPPLHIHDFDQIYVVLTGALEVQVALQRGQVLPGSVVLLPAGVPHRQWNAGDVDEVHLAVMAPSPKPGSTWDYPVHFGLSEGSTA